MLNCADNKNMIENRGPIQAFYRARYKSEEKHFIEQDTSSGSWDEILPCEYGNTEYFVF